MPAPPDAGRGPALPPGALKEDREAVTGVVGSRASDNFVVKWGPDLDAGLDSATVDALLDALLDRLEQAWSVEVDEMSHPAPLGCDRYLLNVYVEDSGLWVSVDGVESELAGSGASGYYYTDPDGYPMLVMSPSAMMDADFGGMVAAHELYHAVQAGLGAYPYRDRGAWYWEASATWMSAQVFPDVDDYAVFLFGYALLPALPVDFFDYPDTGALQEYHQYGAFIVPQYLTEHVADWTVVRDSWVEPDPDEDPIAGLDAALAAWDTTVAAELGAMAAHNAVWDYADGTVYADNVQTWQSSYPDQPVAVAVIDGDSLTSMPESTDTPAWRDVATELQPQAYGYNLVEVLGPPQGALHLHLDLDPTGSAGSEASWTAWLVVADGEGLTYQPVDLADSPASLSMDLTGTEDALWLAVAVTSVERAQDETFAWRFALDLVDAGTQADDTGAVADTGPSAPGAPEPVAACGCQAGRSGGGWILALLGLAVMPLRRRAASIWRRSGADLAPTAQLPPERASLRASCCSVTSPSSSLL